MERESMEFDVVIVGAGPAGLAIACRLMQISKDSGKEITVCVVEKGSEVGAAYAEALRAAGGQAELIEGAGMIHGFFDMGRWSPGAQAVITHSIERFAALLTTRAR